MHVLITGAGGFSGSHLVGALLAEGHTVTAVCGRTKGRLDPSLYAGQPLTLVCGDLSGALALPERIDAVVHAAARSPGPGITAHTMVHDNATASAQLVTYARQAGATTFIYLSTLSVHGRIAGPVADETTPIVDPDAYGMSKYLGELVVREQSQFRSLSVRLPGIIGKGAVRNWLSSCLAAARANRTISLFNPDAPYNNAVHIANLSHLITKVLSDTRWSGHDAVSLGAAGTTTTRHAVETLIDATSSTSTVSIVPATRPPYSISSRRAHELYGYAPMPIEAMLRKFASENVT